MTNRFELDSQGDMKVAASDHSQTRVLGKRILDTSFYRALYSDTSEISDAALVAAAKKGRLSSDRFLNPTEFLQFTLSQGLLPPDFDPIGYRLCNPELKLLDEDWQVVLHFLKFGRSIGCRYGRLFDPEFYRELYMEEHDSDDEVALRKHWNNHNSHYGTLNEALLRNGFRSDEWIQRFDIQAYLVLNSLTERMRNPTQGIVHFIEHGWRATLPMSVETCFEPIFYEEFVGTGLDLPVTELYRHWIELGLPRGVAANEGGQLRQIGLDLQIYPAGFEWQSYLAERPTIPPSDRTRWGALAHLAEIGALESLPLPVEPTVLPNLLLAVADRFARNGQHQKADEIYSRLLLLRDLPPSALQHAADQHLRQERYADALRLYRYARDAGHAQFWTWVNGATCALATGNFPEAQDWLLSGLVAHPRSERLRSLLSDLQRRRFAIAVSRHISLVGQATTATGLETALDEILQAYLAAHKAQYGEQGSCPVRTGAPLRIAFLANQDLPQCTFYRITQKVEQLIGTAVKLMIVDRDDPAAFLSAAATANLALFYRVASNPDTMCCIAACRALGIPTMYEVDDLVFQPAYFPDSLESYAGTITSEQHGELRAGAALARHALRSCDFGLASTEHLAVHMRLEVRTGEVIVHRNGLSTALEVLAKGSVARQVGACVTVFYGSGTKAHGADFHRIVEPALVRLMTERREVRFLACGYVDVASLTRRFPGRVEHVPLQIDRDSYLSLLLNVDINLAVLEASAFNDCKSEIKWLEAAAFCIPSVVSDVGGMREVLRSEQDVVTCSSDPDEWYRVLRRLVVDVSERTRIGQAARNLALSRFAPDLMGKALEKALRRVAGMPSDAVPATTRKRRVLVVNVYFPPQAIGGATRVVRDQVTGVLQGFGDLFELGILCCNEEMADPYRLEAYRWGGVPVWSVTTPHRLHMDWLHHDPAMAPLVGQVLDKFQPDLVHFHCIQRLSLAAVDEVHARGLPFVVTVHDAWWISDHQFLMDALCRLRMPWDLERYSTPANPHCRAVSGARRLAMRARLDAARAVLAVSNNFAEIYRRAGITKVQALRNGLPDLPLLEPTPPKPGKVRLGHIGGITHHKGYFLLRQVLQQGHYDRLELVVTDHSLLPEDVRRERWGASDVLILGRTPQNRIGWLYGQFDVLAALSLWPEGFGLVSREALSYGRWVIASDRGSMAEDVVPGRNGWVVDVSGPEGLRNVLEDLQADPDRFTRPPPLKVAMRSMADMAREVACVWDNVLGTSITSGAVRQVDGPLTNRKLKLSRSRTNTKSL